MTNTSNPYCTALGIPVPRVEDARSSPGANYYGLLLVALLERGAPLTLEAAAARFEEAGVAPAPEALAALKRCKPARPPIYRDGDRYSLDPHDDETDLWAFRLGLRPARAVPFHVVRPDSGPLRTLDQPMTVPELDEAWRDGIPNTWSAQRIAAAVLDAHDTAMSPDDVLAFVRARSEWSLLKADSAQYWRGSAVVRVRDDGRWELDATHGAVRSARAAVRERITVVRRWAEMRPDPAFIKANQQRVERERLAHGEELARMRRVLIHAFPVARPEAVVLVDVAERAIATFIGQEISQAIRRLAVYEIIGAIGVRPLLRAPTTITDLLVARATQGHPGLKPTRTSARMVGEAGVFESDRIVELVVDLRLVAKATVFRNTPSEFASTKKTRGICKSLCDNN